MGYEYIVILYIKSYTQILYYRRTVYYGNSKQISNGNRRGL